MKIFYKISAKIITITLFFLIILFQGANSKTYISLPPEISFKETNYSNDYIKVDVKIPILTYRSNISVEKKINSKLEGDIISFKNQIENSAKTSYQESKNQDFDFIPYEALADFTVNYINDKIISISVTFYTYTGGAHGNTIKESYNFSLETGDKLSLNDLFLENSTYKTIIKDSIKSSIEENSDIYFDDAISVVDKLSNTQSYYLKDNSIVIYYGLYEIAPYSSGIREFEIPFSSLSSELNPKFNLINK